MAKSKLVIQVNAYLAPFGNYPFSGDWFGFTVDNGSGTEVDIHETPSINRDVKGLYINKKQNATDSAKNLAKKLKTDWANTGGYGNVKVTYLGNNRIEIELQNELWTFVEPIDDLGGGNISIVSLYNVPPPTPKTLTLTQGSTVDCNNKYIEYTAVMTGGTLPYTIKGTALGTVTSNSGTKTIQLKRGQDTNIIVTDSTGASIGTELITAPISLEPSYFTVTVSQEELEAQAVVTPNVNLPSAVFPITYSLDDVNYQSSGGFSNLQFEETYTVYIKDGFGCVTSKTFVTPPSIESNETPEVYERYFEISNAGTLIFNRYAPSEKSTFENTMSCEELVGVPYGYVHEFIEDDLIVQQFKSSYDYHRVTLIETDGTIHDITPVMQSQNLRQFEKVDAKLFRDVNGALGIYFRGGNTYIENTETINGVSDYSETNLPSWAVTGNKVKIDNIGTATIKRVSKDSVRGLYILTNYPYSSLTDDDGKVQANYNKQPYNTYEFGFYMNNVTEGRVVIEAGFNDLVETTYISEKIRKIEDDRERYIVTWNDPYNVAGIVHQTGIVHFARLYLNFYHTTRSESSTYRADNETFNLDQGAYDVGVLNVAVFGFKMQQKLHLASGMENFAINGINYKKTKLESEKQGDSNIFVVEGEFELGGNALTVNSDELVLKDPLTGITNKTPIPETIPNILNVGSDALVLNGDGGFILIDNG